MRFLGVGHDCDLGDMYLRLAQAGHEVRVYNAGLEEHGVMRGMLDHVDDWRNQLDWVRAAGMEGAVVFEDTNAGTTQDALRREGFHVIGGSELGDKLENDRAFGQRALAESGLRTVPYHTFDSFNSAIKHIERHPARYVYKLSSGELSSWRNYVGRARDGRDVIGLLQGEELRLRAVGATDVSFILMEHVEGIETGIGAYFNGETFLTPACLDWEHKRFFTGDLGELTGEMGTLVTYTNSERLFSLTLAKLAPLLRSAGHVGYVNLNTIINEQGVWPLELTCRFGYPGFAILDALQCDGWADLFQRMIARRETHFKTLAGFAVGVVLTVPPFPYRYGYAEISRGLPIQFDDELDAEQLGHLHFAEVERRGAQLLASGSTGYLMVANGTGDSVQAAQRSAYALAERVRVPNLRYRTDIGDQFLKAGFAMLRTLGYLP